VDEKGREKFFYNVGSNLLGFFEVSFIQTSKPVKGRKA
jgi:hypothetical protein